MEEERELSKERAPPRARESTRERERDRARNKTKSCFEGKRETSRAREGRRRTNDLLPFVPSGEIQRESGAAEIVGLNRSRVELELLRVATESDEVWQGAARP